MALGLPCSNEMVKLLAMRTRCKSKQEAWILIPVYEDWDALQTLLLQINGLSGQWRFKVLLINDHALPPPGNWLTTPPPGSITSIHILLLCRNVGHQRAIALGLCHWWRQCFQGPVVIMDGDGEDQPSDIMRLLEAAQASDWLNIVFAERRKRSENWVFRLGYHAYRYVHICLTGIPVRFGNFSVLSASHIKALIHQSELWNHYAAAVIRSKLSYDSIPTARGNRLAGRSRMNLAGWVSHGLSALSIYSDIMGTRVLLAAMTGFGLSLLSLIIMCLFASGTGAVSAYYGIVISLIVATIFVQAIAASLLFLFMVLGGRASATFIPVRDGAILTGEEYAIWQADEVQLNNEGPPDDAP